MNKLNILVFSFAVAAFNVFADTTYTEIPTVNIVDEGTVTFNTSVNTQYIGAVVAGGLTKTGEGTLTLFGTNKITGTVAVNAGTLKLAATPLALSAIDFDLDASQADTILDSEMNVTTGTPNPPKYWKDNYSKNFNAVLTTDGKDNKVSDKDANYKFGVVDGVFGGKSALYTTWTSGNYKDADAFFIGIQGNYTKDIEATTFMVMKSLGTPNKSDYLMSAGYKSNENGQINATDSGIYVHTSTHGGSGITVGLRANGSSGINVNNTAKVCSHTGNLIKGQWLNFGYAWQPKYWGEILRFKYPLQGAALDTMEAYLMNKWSCAYSDSTIPTWEVDYTKADVVLGGGKLDLGGGTWYVKSITGMGTVANGTLYYKDTATTDISNITKTDATIENRAPAIPVVTNEYNSTARTIASTASITAVADKKTLLTGHGGLRVTTSLTVEEDATLVLDPVHLPVYVAATPTISGTLELSDYYKDYTLGKMVLLTWSGDSLGATLPTFNNTTATASATLTEETAPDGVSKQLVLTLGDYASNKRSLSILPIGDSITEGCSGNYNDSNYRIPLCEKLTAAGYDVTTRGWLQTVTNNAAGVAAPLAWRHHSGKGGAKLIFQPSPGIAGGLREQIEALLDQAGEPDIITLKAGTNDLLKDNGATAEYATADVLFASLTNVLWRIHNYRPTTKVVLSTVLNMDGCGVNATRAGEYVALIRNLGANATTTYGFPANFLYVNNVYGLLTRGDTDFAASNDVHPSWCGHEKFAESWYTAITNAVAKPPIPGAVAFPANTTSGAAANVPEAYRVGFVQAATLDLTSTFHIGKGTAPTYTTTNSVAPAAYSKVAYYLELKRRDSNHRRFVWVDMDAFKKRNLAKCGFPSDYTMQGVVTNLHVYSNDPAVHNIAANVEGETGWLEFFPYAYGEASSGLVGAIAEHDSIGGWNDTINTAPNKSHGSFQVFRKFKNGEYFDMPAEVVFCHNGWSAQSGYINEIGIGNFARHTTGDMKAYIDYTGTGGGDKADGNTFTTMNAAAYDVIKLEIWVKAGDPFPVPSDHYTWSGAGENNLWSNPANWKLDDSETAATFYPGQDDDTGDTYSVKFPNVEATIDVDVDVTINSFDMTDEGTSGATNLLTLAGSGCITVGSTSSCHLGGYRYLTLDGASLLFRQSSVWFGFNKKMGVITINSGSTVECLGLFADGNNQGDPTIIIDDGTVTAPNVQAKNGGKVIIKSGTVTASSKICATDNTSSIVIIDGGNITAGKIETTSGGDFTILGGNITAATVSISEGSELNLGGSAYIRVENNDDAKSFALISGVSAPVYTAIGDLTKSVKLEGEDYDITPLCTGKAEGDTILAVLDPAKVTPTLNESVSQPFSLDASDASFSIGNVRKGLWYSVKSTNTPDGEYTYGAKQQAAEDGEKISLSVALPESGVKYYRLVVDDEEPSIP